MKRFDRHFSCMNLNAANSLTEELLHQTVHSEQFLLQMALKKMLHDPERSFVAKLNLPINLAW